jgi:hypothetical protein
MKDNGVQIVTSSDYWLAGGVFVSLLKKGYKVNLVSYEREDDLFGKIIKKVKMVFIVGFLSGAKIFFSILSNKKQIKKSSFFTAVKKENDLYNIVNNCPYPTIMINYGYKINIDLLRSEIINFHPSVLPYYKGIMPTPRAWLDKNRSVIGGTVHIATKEFDDGPVLTQWCLLNYNSIMECYINNYQILFQWICSSIIDAENFDSVECCSLSKTGSYSRALTFAEIAKLKFTTLSSD